MQPETVRSALETLSFREAPAPTATYAIGAVRDAVSEESGPAAFNYEVLVSDDPSFEAFLRRILPKLVYFAQCTDRPLPACKGLFVSVFLGDRLFFVHGRDLVARATEVLRVSVGELIRRYGPPEERSEGPPPLLPGR